jgi:uncharacterized protein (TIGR00251 family)
VSALATDAPDGSGALLRVKAVPGAKRDEVVGRLGDRLKVRVTAPPEGGRANAAICELLARELGVKPREVEVVQGGGSAEKVVMVRGVTAADVGRRWEGKGPNGQSAG